MGFKVADKFSETYKVAKEDLISDIDENLPHVLGTYSIVKWAEITSAKLLLPHILETELSVGIRVDIKHSGVSLVNQIISIQSSVTNIKGPIVGFEILVSDEKEIIAKLTHTRVIIKKSDFQKKIDLKV